MAKPKLLYASPFWPKKSGISNYSDLLVPELSAFYDITLLADNYKIESKSLKNLFPTLIYKKGTVYNEFDRILYNFGSQPNYHGYMYDAIIDNPGYIILHDYSLYYLTIGYYGDKGIALSKIYEMNGAKGMRDLKDCYYDNPVDNLLLQKSLSSLLPLNNEIINATCGVLVHSNYVKTMIDNLAVNTPVKRIEHLYKENFDYDPNQSSEYVQRKYNIPSDVCLAVSAGFIAPSKQNKIVCEAVKTYNKLNKKKIYYIMAGEGDYVDAYLDKFIIKTGFIPNDEYWHVLTRGDLIFNLRYPTNGETSGTLLQSMGLGKVCFVTDIGWFKELPDDCVVKLPFDVTSEMLSEKITDFVNRDYELLKLKAKEFINENCKGETVAKEIFTWMS